MARVVEVCQLTDIPQDSIRVVEVDGTPILLLRTEGDVLAVQGRCSHEGYPLDHGDFEAPYLTCGLHYSRFDARDGAVIDPPATLPLACFAVQVTEGKVLLALPEGPVAVNLSE
jgi:3-phenylpropionate/trans-cinnamate dioxygenase ferredoxin component